MKAAAFLAGDWLSGRRLRRAAAALFLLELLIFLIIALATHGVFGPAATPSSTDFISFYAAGHLANLGLAPLAYNQDIHQSAVREIFGSPALPYYYFFYPPVFLVLCQPLARLPYLAAFGLWVTATGALALAAIRRALPDGRHWALFLTFPALFWTAGLGQNALLTAGLLGFGLALIDRRPLTGGALLALVAYKPHFLLLVPVALLAGRHGRALAGFAVCLVLLTGITALAYGPAIWTIYLAHADETRHVFEFGRIPFGGQVSSFAAARLWGAPLWAAYGVQAAVALATAVIVAWLWAAAKPPALKYAGLVAAIPLAAPVVLFYDLMPLALAAAWLTHDIRRTGWARGERAALAAAWIIPGVALPLASLLHLPVGPLAPAVVLALVVLRARPARA